MRIHHFAQYLLLVLSAVAAIAISTSVAASEFDVLDAMKTQGTAVFIRHAYAPGTGDPSSLTLGDCSTQRNLNDQGRQQAKLIGKTLYEHNIQIDAIYTSEWCRCTETAELLHQTMIDAGRKAVPAPQAFAPINSYFSFPENRAPQLEALDEFMRAASFEHASLFITHYVVIGDYTGVYPASGEAVVVSLDDTGSPEIIGRLPFPY